MKNRNIIFIFPLLFLSIFDSHALDIEAYCSDMRQANEFPHEWYLRCVNTLKVQNKYEKIARNEAKKESVRRKEFEILKIRTELTLEYFELLKGIDKSNPDVNKVLSIMHNMKQTCEFTEPSEKSEEEFCQADSYKPYEEMLKLAESKK